MNIITGKSQRKSLTERSRKDSIVLAIRLYKTLNKLDIFNGHEAEKIRK